MKSDDYNTAIVKDQNKIKFKKLKNNDTVVHSTYTIQYKKVVHTFVPHFTLYSRTKSEVSKTNICSPRLIRLLNENATKGRMGEF